LTLEEAKRAAVAVLFERVKAEPRDWIAELNKIAAAEVSRRRVAKEHERWPCDLVGVSRHGSIGGALRNAILDAEIGSEESPTRSDPLSGDDYPLEHYEDGFPKLPDCLRRKRHHDAAPASLSFNEAKADAVAKVRRADARNSKVRSTR
jgi:hypothetical protein